MMTFKELVNHIENRYGYETESPIGLIETIQELTEDTDFDISVEIGFGKDCSWREMGCVLHDFDYIRGWDAEALPEEIADQDFVVAGVDGYEEKGKKIIAIDFYGNPKTNQEKADEKRYAAYEIRKYLWKGHL